MSMRPSVFLCVCWLAAVTAAPAQTGKKVFISVDMEGISGISGDDQLGAGGAEYGRSRKLMADDTNAAILGAQLGGATEIVVNDSHGSMRNLRLEDLAPGARLISHSFKRHGMVEGLDETFDAVIFIGYHAKAGTPTGLFAHTGSGIVADVRVNGRSVGEGGLNTLMADWYGVPVVVVTGDDVAVAQVAEVATSVTTVVTKRAINQRAVELRPLADVHRDITAAARDGVTRARRTTPAKTPPYRVELQLRTTLIPQAAEMLPGIQRPAPDTLAFSAETMPQAYALIRFFYRYVNPD